jgi:serine protease Do
MIPTRGRRATHQRYILYLLLIVLSLSLLSCGGAEPEIIPTATTPVEVVEEPTDTPEPADTATPEATPTPEETATPEGPQPVSSLQDARSAVVQIVAEGSFIDPEVGLQLNTAGSGTGFIIDPAGIAVTNNHVVTGAALLQVYVGGEDRPRNARILGVSECSDLAVIDIDGDGYPFLAWYDGDVNVGLDVYAAGFPLGDPEFTLTRGIISKARASGETDWASVDNVIEHDATINPGNSGGPLITADGQVVGVNYAGASSTNQYFAIGQAEALPVIEQLRAEQDVNSIGINGTAVLAPDEGISGIWVASVDSGSPADRAGIEGGDIVTTLEGLVLATDGTMSSYCDILRSNRPDDVLKVEVLRFATQEWLEGQLNGDPLVVTVNFATELEGEVTVDTGAAYESYTIVNDDTGVLQVEVPASWTDIDGTEWYLEDGTYLGPSITAAPDLDGFWNSWTTPGVFFAAITDVEAGTVPADYLDPRIDAISGSCTYEGRADYSDALYTGEYDYYSDCGGEGVVFVVLAVLPDDGSDFFIIVEIQVVSDADLEALDHILNSFIFFN